MAILWEAIKAKARHKLKLESIVDCILTSNKEQLLDSRAFSLSLFFEQNGNGGASL